ncbi:hypothetical protein AX17_005079 [Amanita inopinata Kibby_2008]|nr:hypothetical protein AX17_005079 [Amanita inopinata Kibby_2008]
MSTSSTTFPRSRSSFWVRPYPISRPLNPKSQVESLLDAHRIEDAIDLADQHRKKLQSEMMVNEDEKSCVMFISG